MLNNLKFTEPRNLLFLSKHSFCRLSEFAARGGSNTYPSAASPPPLPPSATTQK